MTRGHRHHPSKQIKRHARLRHIDLGRPLWVGDDGDWKLMLQNRESVICDRIGCGGRLVPNDPVQKQRYLSYPPNSYGGCGHHDGPLEEPIETDRRMSERHRWMQNYITTLCRRMEYDAVPEQELVDPDGNRVGARADVWIEPARIAVEVQQHPTNFEKRTAARTQGGATQTIWLISRDAGQKADRALFSLPAARFSVLDSRLPYRNRWAVEFEPWRDTEVLDEFAVVGISATIWQRIEKRPYWDTCKLDLHTFMRQVLEGRRVWVSRDPALPRTSWGGFRSGWVLRDDLDHVRSRIAHDEQIKQQQKKTDPPAADGTDAPTSAAAPAPAPAPTPPPATAARGPAAPSHTPLPTTGAVPTSQASPRKPARRADPSPPPATDAESVAAALKIAASVVGVLVLLWISYVVASGLVHEVSSWWINLTHGHPVWVPDQRCAPFCREAD